ncbi:RsmB/NOP family class I SAM-dependent RNA methyltransferase [Aliiruegeria sabulilitoris]|uniref:RsmB/NOP family class I SAM-dependent RNA methyltransferase n=1 Tax=Aliiruegeria sabulilitoris TaxID=1510458 RepID=UPI00082D5305|nr:RsmB/NOP family class I SAM-dependent RNA methyltransferase [Aliiruegeria sabulilitoris]NDR58185.1 RsmB/NOP family class I SAM-dependent RNA methyltransferase [Pseudoruegeria sp. M32A2M]
MTPEARLAAAAEVLDRYLAGEPAEKVLTNWARRSRYAGSKDRAAVRDHVFAAIRRRRSAAWLGGAETGNETGRALIIGLLRTRGQDPEAFLTGQGHALPPLTEAERVVPAAPAGNVALDCPDWLAADLRDSLGEDFVPIMERLQERAEIFVRANLSRGTRDEAQARLAAEDIDSEPVPLASTALRLGQGARRVRNTSCYQEGWVEIQDSASQAVAEAVPLAPDARVLDFCAGGGGKALALAARGGGKIFVHDADPGRMRDIPERAARAGARLETLKEAQLDLHAPFDLVISDVPCSGSGAWRRQPEAKWRLDRGELDRLQAVQRDILDRVRQLVSPGGRIAYMTCSMLGSENEAQVEAFCAGNPEWNLERCQRFSPLQGGDGFFLALLRRTA